MTVDIEKLKRTPCRWCLGEVGSSRYCSEAPPLRYPYHETPQHHKIIGDRDLKLFEIGYRRGLLDGLL